MEHLKTAGDLVESLKSHSFQEAPIYAETPHGTYWFALTSVEQREVDGEEVTVIKVEEIVR